MLEKLTGTSLFLVGAVLVLKRQENRNRNGYTMDINSENSDSAEIVKDVPKVN